MRCIFDLSGVALPPGAPGNTFTLRLQFDRPLPENLRISRDSLRLHCTPAINLFSHRAVPFTPDGTCQEYPLLTSRKHPDRYEIFASPAFTVRKIYRSGIMIFIQ